MELWKVDQTHWKPNAKECFHFSNWNILPVAVIVKILFAVQFGFEDNKLNYSITEKQLKAFGWGLHTHSCRSLSVCSKKGLLWLDLT